MARLVENIATYLAANGIGTKATDIFIGTMPDTLDNCVMIDQTGGVQADRYLPVLKPTVQISVRNTSFLSGLDKISAIYNLLHQKGDNLVLESGGVDVMRIDAMGEPGHLGQDDSSRHLFSCNFVVRLRN
jgi:hypothetical protein